MGLDEIVDELGLKSRAGKPPQSHAAAKVALIAAVERA